MIVQPVTNMNFDAYEVKDSNLRELSGMIGEKFVIVDYDTKSIEVQANVVATLNEGGGQLKLLSPGDYVVRRQGTERWVKFTADEFNAKFQRVE